MVQYFRNRRKRRQRDLATEIYVIIISVTAVCRSRGIRSYSIARNAKAKCSKSRRRERQALSSSSKRLRQSIRSIRFEVVAEYYGVPRHFCLPVTCVRVTGAQKRYISCRTTYLGAFFRMSLVGIRCQTKGRSAVYTTGVDEMSYNISPLSEKIEKYLLYLLKKIRQHLVSGDGYFCPKH